jgi:uncharacterized protein Usg
MSKLEKQLLGYRLTTAEIIYRMPDHPDLLQTYVWQNLDRIPDFPRLTSFLDFWERELAGPLHSVRVAYVGIVEPADWRQVDEFFTLH